jgi:ABC-type lipoprotein release transport system permease subunit
MKFLTVISVLAIAIVLLGVCILIVWVSRHEKERERFKAKIRRVELAQKRWQERQSSRWVKWRLKRSKKNRSGDQDVET